MRQYIELHTSSAFSFLEAASLPEALVDRAVELGYPAIALLDRDGVYGAPRFHLAAKAAGLKAIIGSELTIRTGGPRQTDPAWLWRLPVLVESREGYRNLCRLVTRMKLRAPKGQGALTLDELEGWTSGLVALAGRAALSGERYGVGGLLDRLVGLFGRSQVYVELQRHLLRDEESDNQALMALASAFHVPLVATNGVRFARPGDRPLFEVLTCIRHKTDLDRAGRRLARNAERYLKRPDLMAQLFHDVPGAVAATRELADRLEFTMGDLGYRFPEYPVPPGETMKSFLRKMTEVGARERYRPYHVRARAQIARELDLIEKLDLAGYFLIVWDIVNFCRQHDVLIQGRGSAANSAVCYSLGITAVDPIAMDLLFERFLSEERGEWPDIDLDLPSGDRRERVIQHVYEKYGRLGAGMTANVITYRGRSAAREVGKALALDPERIDRLAKVLNHFEWIDPKDTLDRRLDEIGFRDDRGRIRLFGELWQRIQHLPRHLGQHSGGMVICQGRLDEVVPLENASMPGRRVVQWDKDDCAEMGIVKVDLLGLGMMAVLQDALEIVNQASRGQQPVYDASPAHVANTQSASSRDPALDVGSRLTRVASAAGAPPAPNPRLDLAHLPPDDPAVYRMLQEADTIGIFQVESRAQMATLPRLKPACFYDIVVEVAIIRPGPIVGQMVHPYLKRRAGQEPVSYPHPSLEPILRRTLGVPLFQEQLLRMAMVAAGFSGGEAEELRRAFGFKRSEARMQQVEQKLRAGMARQGITGDPAEEIVRSITSFALYGFPESHAASFALLVYASAYLKAHYSAAFYAAMLNNQPMGFYHPATLVKDAQRRGVRFAPIGVQQSDWLCTVEEDGRIRLGLRYVNGLREEVGRKIVHSRQSSVEGQSTVDRRPSTAGSGRVGLRHGFEDAAGDSAFRIPHSTSPPPHPLICPKCGCDDPSMLEVVSVSGLAQRCFCSTCAHDWQQGQHSPFRVPHSAFRSVEDLIARTGIRRDELATLAEIGALNSFGYHRRSALWQIERAIRPAGELFLGLDVAPGTSHAPSAPGPSEEGSSRTLRGPQDSRSAPAAASPRTAHRARRTAHPSAECPLNAMTPPERLMADYSGTSLTIGPHPMTFRRAELAVRGVLRACDLPRARHGRRIRVAGAVITRQRPGTAKGFVFLTLEDETGISNIIVRPDLFERQRVTVVSEPFLLVEGTLQIQEGVTSVKAERVVPLGGTGPGAESHDFR
jgi:error-prone DNA polymerase